MITYGLNLYYQKVRSLSNKLSCLKTQTPWSIDDIFIFTETWLKENVMLSELGFYSYNVFSHDRTNESIRWLCGVWQMIFI